VILKRYVLAAAAATVLASNFIPVILTPRVPVIAPRFMLGTPTSIGLVIVTLVQ
jgi:hypothetical protein